MGLPGLESRGGRNGSELLGGGQGPSEGGWLSARPDLSAAPQVAGWEAMVLTGRPGATHQSPPPQCPTPGPASASGLNREAGTGCLGRGPLFLTLRTHGEQRRKHSLGPHVPVLHRKTHVAFKTYARDTEIPFRVPQEGLCSQRDTTSSHLSEGGCPAGGWEGGNFLTDSQWSIPEPLRQPGGPEASRRLPLVASAAVRKDVLAGTKAPGCYGKADLWLLYTCGVTPALEYLG